MTQATSSVTNVRKKLYHTPQIQNLGDVSELTCSNAASTATRDGATGFSVYAS